MQEKSNLVNVQTIQHIPAPSKIQDPTPNLDEIVSSEYTLEMSERDAVTRGNNKLNYECCSVN